MNELATFVRLGFLHITDLNAVDHILFLLALAAIYRVSDWRDVLRVITAFTVGHSITLVLVSLDMLRLPQALVEFLIPVTIVATCIENIAVRDHRAALWGGRYRPVFAGIFGLVHGAGFASYLQNLSMGDIVLPLFGFNLGIELGQVVILAVTFGALLCVDRMLVAIRRAPDGNTWSPVRTRAVAMSAVILFIAAAWAVQRSPW
ncbi:MAG: HupE/UreJ family protein [Longimicrobiales bacterium]